MKNFDWFGLAPYAAGSPPAFVLAINLYNSVMTVVDSRLRVIGMMVAAAGIIGMMTVEIGTYKMLARAFADREWRAAGLAFLGACAVTGLIVFSVYTGADTKTLFSSTLVMLIGYLAIMLREYLERNKNNQVQSINVQLEGLRLQLDKAKQEASAERARARAAKAGQVAVSAGHGNLSTGRAGRIYNYDQAKLAAVVDYLKASPDPKAVTVREIASAGIGIGKSAAAIYKNEAMKQVTK